MSRISSPFVASLFVIGCSHGSGSIPDAGSPAVVPLETSCLAANLATIPTYITWDTDDTLPEVVQQENQMWTLVQSLGGTVEYHTTTGTIHPINGLPAPQLKTMEETSL